MQKGRLHNRTLTHLPRGEDNQPEPVVVSVNQRDSQSYQQPIRARRFRGSAAGRRPAKLLVSAKKCKITISDFCSKVSEVVTNGMIFSQMSAFSRGGVTCSVTRS